MRIFDLVLLNHEYDMALLRIKELAACVDAMVFVQPAFTFGSGTAPSNGRRPPFPAELASRLGNGTVHFRHLVAPDIESVCTNLSATTVWRPWCRESYARNALFETFHQLGGGDEDVALVSDADEIPRASALHLLREPATWRHSRRNAVWSLTSIRHYHWSLRCEVHAAWQLGPRAVLGSALRRYGSQAIRLDNRYLCWLSGYHATCPSRGYPPRPILHRVIPNASWHLSTMSGGIGGVMAKLVDNSDYVPSRLQTADEIARRSSRCLDHLGRDHSALPEPNLTFARQTPWSLHNLPSYPDVPRVLAAGLRTHTVELAQFLSLSHGTPPTEVLDAIASLPAARCATAVQHADTKAVEAPHAAEHAAKHAAKHAAERAAEHAAEHAAAAAVTSSVAATATTATTAAATVAAAATAAADQSTPQASPSPPHHSAWRWCVVMSDNRPPSDLPSADSCTAFAYARHHGYGFVYTRWVGGSANPHSAKQTSARPAGDRPTARPRASGGVLPLGNTGCIHPRRGALSPYWCKIPAVAHAMLHGVEHRPCERLVYLDTDVRIINRSLSLDAYFDRARRLRDEALQDDMWHLLFTSNAPHVHSGLCTGLFFVRNGPTACGILRNWFDADWPDKPLPWSFEQGAMAEGVHAYHRAYGDAVRLMPTSTTWRWEEIPKLAPMPWRASPSDALFHHRCRRVGSSDENCLPSREDVPAPSRSCEMRDATDGDGSRGRAVDAVMRLLHASEQVFAPYPSDHGACPVATPRIGVRRGDFMSAATCCRHGKRLAPSRYHLNGSRSPTPRPCWSSIRISARDQRWTDETWTCQG